MTRPAAEAGLLPLALGLALGEPGRLLGRPQQGAGLAAALLVFRLGVAVGDDAAARLHVKRAVLDDRGAQRDAGVDLAVRRDVADAATVDAAPLRLQLVDDLHRPNLRRT